MKAQLLIGMLFALTLVGCGKSTEGLVTDSVQSNQDAPTLGDWESSESHPEVLFSRWRAESKDAAKALSLKTEICDALARLDGQALTVFEEEIRKPENKELLSGCRKDLHDQLNTYYADQRSRVPGSVDARVNSHSQNQFRFPENVQVRDFSNGYYAVSGDVAKKEVILTFDDGPSGVYTPSILRSLKEVNAKAMFFPLGKSVRANPDIVKLVAADGHSVGSHSVTHRCLGTRDICARNNGRLLSFDEAVDEIKGGHQAVYDVLGWVDPTFRFPFGETSPELRSFLKSNSVGEFYWAIDSEDWKAQSNEEMLRKTLAQVDQRGRGIVLFHDIQRKTAETLPAFLSELYKRGYSVVVLKPADPSARYNSKLVKKKLP